MEWTREYPQADGAMPSERKRHYSRFVYIAVIVLAIAVALFLVYDLNGKSLDLSDREARIIITDSMDGDPTQYEISTIPVNAMVMIERLDQSELSKLKVGDVLSFYNKSGMLINHRIISIDSSKQQFTTHGDNTHANETVQYKDVHGKVVGVNPWLGKAMTWLKDNIVFVVIGLVFLFAAVTAVKWVFSRGDSA